MGEQFGGVFAVEQGVEAAFEVAAQQQELLGMVAGDVQGGVVGRCGAEHGLGVFDHRVDVGAAYQADADVFAACGVGLAVAAVEDACPFEQFGGEGCGVGAVDVEPFGTAADGLGGEFFAAVAAKGFVLPMG